MPGSFKELCRVFNHVVGHIVAFKISEDKLKIDFKQQFDSVVRLFDFNPDSASVQLSEKNKILN